ncbi:FxsC protein, partial [Streptomyces clavuligerus]
HDLPEGRAPDYYGKQSQDWNPYHPDSARPLAYIAQDLVRSLDYQATVSSFDHELPPAPGQPPGRPEILLVDRWALEDDDRCARLAAFDATPRPWVGVVVAWNREDPQSRISEAQLVEKLERTMPHQMSQGRAACRAAARGVFSMEAFGQILPQVVEAAAQEYLRHATAFAPSPSPGAIRPVRARLAGPTAGFGSTPCTSATRGTPPDAEDTDDSQS